MIKKRKFKPLDLVTGGGYRLSPRTRLNIDPTFTNVYYNTVEGWNVNLSGKLRHQYDSLRRSFEVTPTLRYGFDSETF
ncbi:DUF5686 family protein, partial [Pontibacter sp. BAB1700]|uniref:DUF5686 family protein n=1 Tax=Pontibacter sp. BAB1700 TaxID=1144253 RepID=UPI00026BDE08